MGHSRTERNSTANTNFDHSFGLEVPLGQNLEIQNLVLFFFFFFLTISWHHRYLYGFWDIWVRKVLIYLYICPGLPLMKQRPYMV